MNTTPKMYLILREDLTYKYIQASHALAQFALEHPFEFNEWNNSFIICLSVFNGKALDELLTKFKDDIFKYRNKNNIYTQTFELDVASLCKDTPFKISMFCEPDLKSPLPTAIAFYYNGRKELDVIMNHIKDLKLATK